MYEFHGIYIHNRQKARCPLTGELIRKLWYINTGAQYLVIKRDPAIDSNNNMDGSQRHYVNKLSQTWRTDYVIPLIWSYRLGQNQCTEQLPHRREGTKDEIKYDQTRIRQWCKLPLVESRFLFCQERGKRFWNQWTNSHHSSNMVLRFYEAVGPIQKCPAYSGTGNVSANPTIVPMSFLSGV